MTDGNFELPKKIDQFLAAVSKLYELDGNRELQQLIVNAKVRVHEGWTFDNWNGGTTGHALYLVLPEQLFLNSARKRNEVQSSIQSALNGVHNLQNEYIAEVFLELEVEDEQDWRAESGLLVSPSRNVSSDAQRRIWTEDSFRLFLSHKSEFKKETGQVKEQLSGFGVSAFVAHEDIHPSQAWQDEIENALNTMDGFAALLTPDFHDSDWTDQEVGFAYARGVPRIAVMLGKSPYGFIGKFQGLRSTWENAAKDIVGALINCDRMFSIYLNELRKCPNWDQANVLSSLLGSVKYLTRDQINELIKVYNETSELHWAFGFTGTRPVQYGPGLVSHLHRLDTRRFKIGPNRQIESIS